MTADWSLHRIESLSDGVFAVAMTLLLVMEPAVPRSISDLGAHPTFGDVLELLPHFRGVAASFFVTAMLWIGHHQLFRSLVRGDLGLVWLNFLLLFGIAIQPITTNLLGGFEQPMVVVYAANMVFVSAILFVMWAYALIGRRLVEPSIDSRYARSMLFRTAVGPCLFLTSIPVSFFSTTLAVLIWFLASPLAFWVVRHKRG
jgi:TMEM175 potassium channel family protein